MPLPGLQLLFSVACFVRSNWDHYIPAGTPRELKLWKGRCAQHDLRKRSKNHGISIRIISLHRLDSDRPFRVMAVALNPARKRPASSAPRLPQRSLYENRQQRGWGLEQWNYGRQTLAQPR